MSGFLKRLVAFVIVGLLLGEIVSRVLVLNSDVPRREINQYGIQSYIPNQKGDFKGGAHQWQINQTGWPGPMPDSFDNVVTILGDSFIENFMSPDSHHQNSLMKKEFPNYNFYEAARSGVSFIEAMEISKQLDSLQPKMQIIHLHDSDLRESIVQIQALSDITQVDLESQKIVFGEMKRPGLKLVLYNWKFAYYLFNRFSPSFIRMIHPKPKEAENKKVSDPDFLPQYEALFRYTKSNYKIADKLLVFRPESDSKIVDLATRMGFRTIWLDSKGDPSWTFDYDHHWTSFGHERVALQLSNEIKKRKLLN
ncbi:MAG: hypothetical protein OIF50_01205 [Flavobacteriaceae bacterium]|nr:hypothetical protein [Flavobacteriaceae bacterium]